VVPTWSCAECEVLDLPHRSIPTLLGLDDDSKAIDDEMEDEMEHDGVYIDTENFVVESDDEDEVVRDTGSEDISEMMNRVLGIS